MKINTQILDAIVFLLSREAWSKEYYKNEVMKLIQKYEDKYAAEQEALRVGE